jgi:hypothetical protein
MVHSTNKPPFFFDRKYVEAASKKIGLDSRVTDGLASIADQLQESDAASSLAEHYFRIFYHSQVDAQTAGKLWNDDILIKAEIRYGLGALLMLAGIPQLESYYKGKGISPRIFLDSTRDLSLWLDDFHQKTGQIGLELVWWLLFTMKGELFRIGRLQFMHQPLKWDIAVAQKGPAGPVVLFFAQEVQLREDGQVDGTNGIRARNPYRSVFAAGKDGIEGTPIHPGGYTMRNPVSLDTQKWRIVAKPGDGSLDIHIPKDGKMDIEQCNKSLGEAFRLFGEIFPEKEIRIFTMCSWLLDAQFQQILSPQTNIVRFQREFYLFPVLSDEKSTYDRVFGNPEIDIAKAPEDTSLQKDIKRYVLTGERMRYNAGIMLPEHLGILGDSYYQKECAREIEKLVGGSDRIAGAPRRSY